MARKKQRTAGQKLGLNALPRVLKIEASRRSKAVADSAAAIAELATKALSLAEQRRIKDKPVKHLPLSRMERDVLAMIPSLLPKLKKALVKKEAKLTVAEVANLTLAVAEVLPDAEPVHQAVLLIIARGLIDCLEDLIDEPAPAARGEKAAAGRLFQFKITLKGTKPPIWRRIQVPDCTLDQLHEHIQTAMGWTNSHLHQFEIDGKRYGDPELLNDGFDDFDCSDSTVTRLSDIVPKTGMKSRFKYEYDFGDSWEHEVMFERCPAPEPKTKYPLCLAGARACPPEDVGGVWGYANYLEALADPTHERHGEFMEWGGSFDPEVFDPSEATKAMRQGLPNWRG